MKHILIIMAVVMGVSHANGQSSRVELTNGIVMQTSTTVMFAEHNFNDSTTTVLMIDEVGKRGVLKRTHVLTKEVISVRKFDIKASNTIDEADAFERKINTSDGDRIKVEIKMIDDFAVIGITVQS